MHPHLSLQNPLAQSLAPQPAPHLVDARNHGAIRRWMHRVMSHWHQRKLIAALEAMDDRLLADVGLCRADIRRSVADLIARESPRDLPERRAPVPLVDAARFQRAA